VDVDTRVLEGIVTEMRAAATAAEQERGRIDKRWSPVARQEKTAEIDTGLMGRLSEMRRAGREAVGRAQDLARLEYQRAQLSRGPQTPEQWTEANNRRPFVAEDLSGDLVPENVIAAYDAAGTVGDTVGQWLIGRIGGRRLSELATVPGEGVIGGRAARALRLLQDRITGTLDVEYEAARGRIRRLAAEIEAPYGTDEQDRAATRIKARFGV